MQINLVKVLLKDDGYFFTWKGDKTTPATSKVPLPAFVSPSSSRNRRLPQILVKINTRGINVSFLSARAYSEVRDDTSGNCSDRTLSDVLFIWKELKVYVLLLRSFGC